MTGQHVSPSRESPRHGGIWRRTGSVIVDIAIVLIFLQVIGTIAYFATDGRVQSSGFIRIAQCQWPPAPPAVTYPYGDIYLEPDSGDASQRECFLGVPGMPHAHFIEVTQQKSYGPIKISNQARILLDGQNRAGWILWIGLLGVPLVVAYRAWAESRTGQTIGKRLLGLRVSSPSGLPTFFAALTRNAMLFAPMFAFDVVSDGWLLLTPNVSALSNAAGWAAFAVYCVYAGWYATAMFQIWKDKNTFYNQYVGVTVRREIQAQK